MYDLHIKKIGKFIEGGREIKKRDLFSLFMKSIIILKVLQYK